MDLIPVGLATVIAMGLAAFSASLAHRVTSLQRKLREALAEADLLSEAARERDALRAERAVIAKKLEEASAADRAKSAWLARAQQEMNALRAELEKRPSLTRVIDTIESSAEPAQDTPVTMREVRGPRMLSRPVSVPRPGLTPAR